MPGGHSSRRRPSRSRAAHHYFDGVVIRFYPSSVNLCKSVSISENSLDAEPMPHIIYI